jgi:hypothetical protein
MGVWPHHQPKSLQQAVATDVVGIDTFHIFRDPRRLRIPEYGNANRPDVTRPAGDPVEFVGLGPAPARQKKSAGNGLVTAVKVPQQRN